MMTTSGHRSLPKESLKVRRAMLSRPRHGSTPEQKFENVLDHYVRLYGVIGSPGYPPEPTALRERLARGVKRAFRPQAVARQLVAIAADARRAERLPRITAPTLVIHGEADALIPVAAAHDLARRIPGARLETLAGWGHAVGKPVEKRGRKATGLRAPNRATDSGAALGGQGHGASDPVSKSPFWKRFAPDSGTVPATRVTSSI